MDLDLKKIDSYFPEIFQLKPDCKFYNCIHKNEPSCRVKLKVKEGLISSSRYNNYLAMLDEEESSYRKNSY